MTKPKVTPFDAADYLTSDEAIAEYLTAAAEGGEAAHIAQAMGTVVRARNLSQLARDTGMTRAGMRRALSEGGNPRLDTVAKILGSIGIVMSFAARKAEKPAKKRKVA